MNRESEKDNGMCPLIAEMHEECLMNDFNSVTIELVTIFCSGGNYADCSVYSRLTSPNQSVEE